MSFRIVDRNGHLLGMLRLKGTTGSAAAHHWRCIACGFWLVGRPGCVRVRDPAVLQPPLFPGA